MDFFIKEGQKGVTEGGEMADNLEMRLVRNIS